MTAQKDQDTESCIEFSFLDTITLRRKTMSSFFKIAMVLSSLVVFCSCDKEVTSTTKSEKEIKSGEVKTDKPESTEKVEEKLVFSTPEELGKFAFSALQKQDENMFMKSLATENDMKICLEKATFPDEKTKQEAIEATKTHLQSLHELFRNDYKEAQKRAKDLGITWKNTKLTSIETRVKKTMGLSNFSSMYIKFTCSDIPGKEIVIRMDDGYKCGNTWLFTDKMINNLHIQ